MKKHHPALAIATMLAAASPVFAHPWHIGQSLKSGAVHPLTGIDHILAAMLVGIWAVRAPRSVRMIPMFCIAIFAAAVSPQWLAERFADAASIVCLALVGALCVTGWKVPRIAAMTIVLSLALFQGAAHSAAIAPGNDHLWFAIGLAATTAGISLVAATLTALVQRGTSASRASAPA